jgi:hypothetical protein
VDRTNRGALDVRTALPEPLGACQEFCVWGIT